MVHAEPSLDQPFLGPGFSPLVTLCVTKESLSEGLLQLLTDTVYLTCQHTQTTLSFQDRLELRKTMLYRAPLTKAELESSNWTQCGQAKIRAIQLINLSKSCQSKSCFQYCTDQRIYDSNYTILCQMLYPQKTSSTAIVFLPLGKN